MKDIKAQTIKVTTLFNIFLAGILVMGIFKLGSVMEHNKRVAATNNRVEYQIKSQRAEALKEYGMGVGELVFHRAVKFINNF